MAKIPMANETKVVNLVPTPEKFALTGISGLDSILEGGIPRSNVTLVEGAIGTGKTTMGVEFVYRGASEFDEPGIIVLFEVSPEKVVRDAVQLGWDLAALERQGRVKIVFTTRQVFRQELQQADSLLLQEAAEMGAARIFVDGVAGVIDVGGDGRVQAPRAASRDRAAAFDPSSRVTTGVPGLDEIVNGGYFLGSTTVVAGISGVGKSVMALQYIAEGARLGEPSLMLTLDEQVPQVLRNANSIGIDLQTHIDRGVVQLYYDPPQEIEVDHHFHTIEQIVKDFRPRRAVLDSISTYGSSLGTQGRLFRDFFHALVALMKEYQVAAVYNHENPEMLGMSSMMGAFGMSSLVDNIILMNWIELGDTFRLGLTVAKMRANPTVRETHECEITDGQGMRVLPRHLPRAAPMAMAPFSSFGGLISRAPERHTQGPEPGEGTGDQ